MSEYISGKKAMKILNTTLATLRYWEKKGNIETIKTDGGTKGTGHRRYKLEDVIKLSRKGLENIVFEKNNYLVFCPKLIFNFLDENNKSKLKYKETFCELDTERVYIWEEGMPRPMPILCFNSEENYYKLFKYPKDIEDNFTPAQKMYLHITSVEELIKVINEN